MLGLLLVLLCLILGCGAKTAVLVPTGLQISDQDWFGDAPDWMVDPRPFWFEGRGDLRLLFVKGRGSPEDACGVDAAARADAVMRASQALGISADEVLEKGFRLVERKGLLDEKSLRCSLCRSCRPCRLRDEDVCSDGGGTGFVRR